MWPFRGLGELCHIAEQLFDHYAVVSSSSQEEPGTPYLTRFELGLIIEVLFGFVPGPEELDSAFQKSVSDEQDDAHAAAIPSSRRMEKHKFLEYTRSVGETFSVASSVVPWQDVLWDALDEKGRGYITRDDVVSLGRMWTDASKDSVTSRAMPHMLSDMDVFDAARAFDKLDDDHDGRVMGSEFRGAMMKLAR